MIGISLLLHLVIFSLMIFLPGFMSFSGRAFPGTIYQVDLVTLSGLNGQKSRNAFDAGKGNEMVLKSDQAAKRIAENNSKEEEPVKIAKLTTIMKNSSEKSQEASSAELIKETIAKIEKQAKAEKQTKQEEDRQIEEAIAGLKNQAKTGPDTGQTQVSSGTAGLAGGTPTTGSSVAMQIYQSETEAWIKSKWSYPVALSNPKDLKDLEVVVELLVKANGSIEKTTFIKRSNNPGFNASILKAIERANPLPPFPEGYNKSDEEIQITFNLKKLLQ
jgi:colicin import membrane protein